MKNVEVKRARILIICLAVVLFGCLCGVCWHLNSKLNALQNPSPLKEIDWQRSKQWSDTYEKDELETVCYGIWALSRQANVDQTRMAALEKRIVALEPPQPVSPPAPVPPATVPELPAVVAELNEPNEPEAQDPNAEKK